MTAKKSIPVSTQPRSAPARTSSAYHRLNTLLHTIRSISHYEDALCELAHEAKSGQLSDEARAELDGILKSIPAQEYVHDLNAVIVMLKGSPGETNSAAKRTAKSSAVRKRSLMGRKSGEKSAAERA